MSHPKFPAIIRSAFLIMLIGSTAFSQADTTATLRRNFKLFGGLCVPAGDLGATTTQYAGYAKTGFDVGADFSVEAMKNLQIGMMGNFALHSVDETSLPSQMHASSWKLIWIMASVGFIAELGPAQEVYGRGNAGIHIGFGPDFRYASADNASATYSSATSIAYGFAAGILFSNTFDFGFQFLSAEPEYLLTVTGPGGLTVTKVKQLESLIQFNFGFVFN